jgi:hypothetical protein
MLWLVRKFKLPFFHFVLQIGHTIPIEEFQTLSTPVSGLLNWSLNDEGGLDLYC